MATLEDVIKTICDDVTLSLTNEFQKVYVINTPFQARLTHEILVVYGLDVKIYPQEGKASKLYVSHPTVSDAQAQKIYDSALHYARALKDISVSMDQLVVNARNGDKQPSYNINFIKNSPTTRQILVQLTLPQQAQAGAQSTHSAPVSTQPAAAAQAANPAPAVAKAPAAPQGTMAESQARAKKKYGEKKPEHYEELSSGPAVGRRNYPGKLSKEGEAKANSTKRRMMLHLFGNMTQGSMPAMVMALTLGVAFSMLVMLRGFVCADLAVAHQNKAWYCKIGKETPKPKQKKSSVSPR